jgi:hypothetical protein
MTPYEERFWKKFPGLLSEDLEDEHGQMIMHLRKRAKEIFEILASYAPELMNLSEDEFKKS